MSLRNIRKIYGNNTLPPPEDASDEEYEPLYAKASSKSNYAGLLLSSHSENEEAEPDVIEEENEEKISKKKKKKKKRKQNKAQNENREVVTHVEEDVNEELDEIDRSVLEVNAMLGKPPTPPPTTEEAPLDPAKAIMQVQHKHLNSANERFFGSKPTKTDKKSKRVSQRLLNTVFPLHLRKNAIVPLEKYQMGLQRNGLSMSVARREGDCTYFTFDHSKEYQTNHTTFIQMYRYTGPLQGLHDQINLPLLEDAQRSMHVEVLMECADTMFRLEEHTAGNTLIEQVVTYMQYAAHPAFNLADPKTRLEYKYLENRTFHVVILKYLHLLTNRACHRTALELAKLLLNLDPFDPLAVLFIIDTLALRAREHEWLIAAVDHWKEEREAGFLFNIQFSYAMAKFHVAKKNQADTSEADELLQTAIRWFPFLAQKLLEFLNLGSKAHLRDHELFKTMAVKWTAKDLKGVLNLYVKFAGPRWREPMVAEWFIRNVEHLVSKYNSDNAYKEETKNMAMKQYSVFRVLPKQLNRHLCVIKPMEKLLVDGEIPEVKRYLSCDPLPPADGINRYQYGVGSRQSPATTSALLGLFASVMPHYQVPEEVDGNALQIQLREEELIRLVAEQARLIEERANAAAREHERDGQPPGQGQGGQPPGQGQGGDRPH